MGPHQYFPPSGRSSSRGILAAEARQRGTPAYNGKLIGYWGVSRSVRPHDGSKTRLQLAGFSRILKSTPTSHTGGLPVTQTVDTQPLPTRLIGYARLSAADHLDDPQMRDLLDAGCGRIYQEYSSAISRARPVLSRLLGELTAGDVLVIVSLDRLARSVTHLVHVINDLEERGVAFRSIRDQIDTSNLQGASSLQVLRAVGNLERALITERTKDGIREARARGRLPGNPGLRERKPEAIRAVSHARQKAYFDGLEASAQTWLPTVRQLRPQHSWDNVVRVLNFRGQDWSVERLRRAVHRMFREKLVEADVLARSPRRAPEDSSMKIVAAIAIANPGLPLKDIAAQLDKMGEPPVKGTRKWKPSSVRHLLDEAHRFGLIPRSRPT